MMEVGVGENRRPGPGPVPDPLDLDQDGWSSEDGDCDDENDNIGPDVTEICDGVDNDCSGTVDLDENELNACATQDLFQQTLTLDVLFVIDTSPTMDAFLSRAGDGAQAFLEPLVGAAFDTHIGVVTMDVHDPDTAGKLVAREGRPFVTGDTMTLDDASRWLRLALLDNVESTSPPQARTAASIALGLVEDVAVDVDAEVAAPGQAVVNPYFLRDEAELQIVILSDREDETPAPSVWDFLDAVEDLKGGSLSRATTHAIAQLGDLDCDGNSAPERNGESYQQLASFTAGTTLAVCTKDYAPFLSAIGQFAATQGLSTRFELARPADPESMRVTIVSLDGATTTLDNGDFALTSDQRTLVLTMDPPPEAGSTIVVDYLEDPLAR